MLHDGTWFIPEPDDEMGHYRLLTGYDDAEAIFVTQDSYQGADQRGDAEIEVKREYNAQVHRQPGQIE